MQYQRTIGNLLDRAATLPGLTIPLIAVILAAYLTWQRLTTWRDIAIFGAMYSCTALGITVGSRRTGKSR